MTCSYMLLGEFSSINPNPRGKTLNTKIDFKNSFITIVLIKASVATFTMATLTGVSVAEFGEGEINFHVKKEILRSTSNQIRSKRFF